MLVFTRREGQTIQIGDVVVTIVKTHSGRVKVGIDAPKEVRVMRGELDEPPAKEVAVA